MTDGFALLGYETVLTLLERLQEEALAARAQDAARAELEAVREEAKALCPKETGALQASIHVRITADGGEVVADAPYAAAVEIGSIYRQAQPFLLPALQMRQSEVISGVHLAAKSVLKER